MQSQGFFKILITFLALGTLSCSPIRQESVPTNENSIVNGSSYRENDVRPLSLVLLKTNYKPTPQSQVAMSQCTGVLISGRYILTAAHCVQFDHIEKSEVIFPLAQISETYTTKQVLIHPEYNSEVARTDDEQLRDLALIKLAKMPPANYVSLPLLGIENKIPALTSFEV